jgi:transcription antitermination factor NusG
MMRLMSGMTIPKGATNAADHPGLGSNFFEPLWYAAYTKANHEKRVAQQLEQRCVEHFLPVYQSIRRWKDRRICLQMPLFPGYVFVRLALRDRLKLLQIPGVVQLVNFNNQPAPLPEEDILAIRNCLGRSRRVEPHPYMQAGLRVQVMSGPLQGLEGVLLRRKNKARFVLSFDLIMRSVAVEIDEVDLGPAS